MDSNQPNFTRILVISIFLSLVAGFIGGGVSSNFLFARPQAAISENQSNTSNSQVITTPQEQAVEKVAKDIAPSTVSIIATQNLSSVQSSNLFNQFFGLNPFNNSFPSDNSGQSSDQQQEVGGGTGFIISADGLILTNKHVVDIQGANYTVLTNDGQKYPAKILASDPVQDLAIIKIDKNGLPPVKLGDSDNLEIGQTVVAIGNALGEFRNTLSVGVISGLGRSITASDAFSAQAEQLEGVIQTDAAINPGNSGGPLLNLSGEVIGINVAVAQGAQNIGFALPINLVKRDIQQVQKQGKITYPFLGVRYLLVNQDIKQRYNLSVDYGALILRGQSAGDTAVVPGGPADKAGIKENDIILEVEGQKIDSDNTLSKLIQKHSVGDTVNLKILSDGKEKLIKVSLGER